MKAFSIEQISDVLIAEGITSKKCTDDYDNTYLELYHNEKQLSCDIILRPTHAKLFIVEIYPHDLHEQHFMVHSLSQLKDHSNIIKEYVKKRHLVTVINVPKTVDGIKINIDRIVRNYPKNSDIYTLDLTINRAYAIKFLEKQDKFIGIYDNKKDSRCREIFDENDALLLQNPAGGKEWTESFSSHYQKVKAILEDYCRYWVLEKIAIYSEYDLPQ